MTTLCRACGTPIIFKLLPNGKLCPTALDGGDHFDLCSKLRGEIVKREGTHFSNRDAEGYYWRGGRKFVRLSGHPIIGKEYTGRAEMCGVACNLPPWEYCACSFDNLFDE